MPVAKAIGAGWLILGLGLPVALAAQQQQQQQQKASAAKPDAPFVVQDRQLAVPDKPAPATPAAQRLPDPPPDQIAKIIDAFSTKERLFRTLLKNDYTYTESILMQTLDDSGNPDGDYQQVNDIQYSPEGARRVVCTFCPQPALKDVEVTQEDLDDMFNMDMYTISVDELGEYNVNYVDHEPLDQITAYKFSVAPKKLEKGKRYFQGNVWVDDHDLMIVKTAGKAVPDEVDKHGNPANTFLPFQTWRQEVDGKYWFPVYTLMQGKVPGGPGTIPTPVKMVIQFKDYKQFKSSTRILSIATLPDGASSPVAQPPASSKPVLPTIPH